jgi:hypothetical protein
MVPPGPAERRACRWPRPTWLVPCSPRSCCAVGHGAAAAEAGHGAGRVPRAAAQPGAQLRSRRPPHLALWLQCGWVQPLGRPAAAAAGPLQVPAAWVGPASPAPGPPPLLKPLPPRLAAPQASCRTCWSSAPPRHAAAACTSSQSRCTPSPSAARSPRATAAARASPSPRRPCAWRRRCWTPTSTSQRCPPQVGAGWGAAALRAGLEGVALLLQRRHLRWPRRQMRASRLRALLPAGWPAGCRPSRHARQLNPARPAPPQPPRRPRARLAQEPGHHAAARAGAGARPVAGAPPQPRRAARAAAADARQPVSGAQRDRLRAGPAFEAAAAAAAARPPPPSAPPRPGAAAPRARLLQQLVVGGAGGGQPLAHGAQHVWQV